jgi:hypothetical protein
MWLILLAFTDVTLHGFRGVFGAYRSHFVPKFLSQIIGDDGRDGRHRSFAGELFHEPVQEIEIY